MHFHPGGFYFIGVGTVALVAQAADASSPWVVTLLAIVAPIGPVLVGYLLTSRKLKKQDAKVEQVHVLVNSQLTHTLNALAKALTENVRLKDQAGIPVSPTERLAAQRQEAHLPVDEVEEELGEIDS